MLLFDKEITVNILSLIIIDKTLTPKDSYSAQYKTIHFFAISLQ